MEHPIQLKLQHMKDMLDSLNIEIIGLTDIGVSLEVDESGSKPLENARMDKVIVY